MSSSDAKTFAIDAALGAALVAALFAVFTLETPQTAVQGPKLTAAEPAVEPAPTVRPLRLAVTPESNAFDDMGRLLDKLGQGYVYRPMPFDDLLDEARVGQFDVIFVTCSGYTDTWLGEEGGASPRGGQLFGPNEATFAKAKQVLRRFVTNGGTLYASDLHYNLIAKCFPEFVDESLLNRGAPQTLRAEVVDPSLRQMLGDGIDLTFDQTDWRPAAFSGQEVLSYLKGSFKTVDGTQATAPLLVKFPLGQGSVIFTSFHNEKQQSEQEMTLLKFLVFSAVTAGVDAEATRTMARGGFAETKKNLFSASGDAEAVSQTYDNKEVANLQFVLAFADQSATLELRVDGPGGVSERRRGASTISIDVPGAAVGEWKYTITAVKVPSENFPFTITVGKKR